MKTLFFSLFLLGFSCSNGKSSNTPLEEAQTSGAVACWVEAWYGGIAVNSDGALDNGCHTVVIGVLCNDSDGSAVLMAYGIVEVGACEDGLVVDTITSSNGVRARIMGSDIPPPSQIKKLKDFLTENQA